MSRRKLDPVCLQRVLSPAFSYTRSRMYAALPLNYFSSHSDFVLSFISLIVAIDSAGTFSTVYRALVKPDHPLNANLSAYKEVAIKRYDIY